MALMGTYSGFSRWGHELHTNLVFGAVTLYSLDNSAKWHNMVKF